MLKQEHDALLGEMKEKVTITPEQRFERMKLQYEKIKQRNEEER